MENPSPRRNYEVASLMRGLTILDCFVASPDRDFSLTDVANMVGIHRSTVYRFLSTLERDGYVAPGNAPNSYRLGPKWRSGDEAAPWPSTLTLVAIPVLNELMQETGETADLNVYYQGEMVVIQTVEGSQSVRVRQRVGTVRPPHMTAAGKIMLSSFDENTLEEWIQGCGFEVRTPNSIGTPQGLRKELAEIRRSGYAVDHEEYEIGLACIAAPVRDASRRVIAAVSISGPSGRFTYHSIAELAAMVRRAGDRLSEVLGAPAPVAPARLSLTREATQPALAN